MDRLVYSGSILSICLSSGNISSIPKLDYAARLLGGRGIVAGIYRDEVSPSTGLLEPEDRLFFITGPLCGSTCISGSQWRDCGKSPTADPKSLMYCNLGDS